MVDLKPRPMRPIPERPVIIQSGENCLEGLLINKKTDFLPALFNSPNPKFGGNMNSTLLNELAYALNQEGISSLRYNYRGVGASQGESLGNEEEAKDMMAALEFLLESTTGNLQDPLVVAGYSFGAWIAYLNAKVDHRIKRTLLISPPIEKLDFSNLSRVKGSLAILVGEKDHFCPVDTLKDFLKNLADKNTSWKPPAVYVVLEASHYFVHGLNEAGKVGAHYLQKGKFPKMENSA